MNCPDADRMTELKYHDYVQEIIARLKSLPGGVWSCFSGGIQSGESVPVEGPDPVVEQMCREVIGSCPEPELKLLWLGTEALWNPDDENPDSRTVWEAGVVKELYERVRYAAGDAALDGDEKEGPGGNASEARFRFDEDELVFLSKVARQLVLLTARRGLTPEQAKAIRRAVAALKRLPEPTLGIDVLIEVSHRMGNEEFRESYRYVIKLEEERIAITSSGSQQGLAVGTNSFALESLEWQADGQTAQQGSRDAWLERLAYALGRDYTLNVTDESGGKSGQVPGAVG
jgi:hypothetical protein